MVFFDWLQQLRDHVRSDRGGRRARNRRQRQAFRPAVKRLEERTMPSMTPFQVFNTGVDNNGVPLPEIPAIFRP
jgi:hypothetical protein